jgi:hypothetical protein
MHGMRGNSAFQFYSGLRLVRFASGKGITPLLFSVNPWIYLDLQERKNSESED